MNLILKATNTEKSKIRQFPVSFSDNKSFAVIYEYLPDYESFLPDLIEGIQCMTTESVTIYCTSDQMYSTVNDIKKVNLKEGKVEFTEPKNKLTDNKETV